MVKFVLRIKLKTAENLPWSWRTYAAPWSLRALWREYSDIYVKQKFIFSAHFTVSF